MDSLYAAQYAPGPVPSDVPPSVARYLQEELQKISAAMSLLADGNYTATYAPPARVAPGIVRYADGVRWAPDGMGDGWFGYKKSGAWVRLG